MKALNPNATKVITCPFDVDEPKAEFDISIALPHKVRMELLDTSQGLAADIKDGESVPSELHGFLRACAKAGLRGVRNVYDRSGKLVVMNGQGATDAILDELSEVRIKVTDFDNLVNWIGTQVWTANQLDETEKKTSDSPLTSETTS
jgi:hypothetical protein